MTNKTVWSTTAILLMAFVVLVIGGRYFFSHKSTVSNSNDVSISDATPIQVSNTTDIVSSSTASSVSSDQTSTSSPSTSSNIPKEQSCAQTLQAKTKADKTEYEKGSILIGFKPGVSFESALKIVGSYGGAVLNQKQSKENYAARSIVTVTVPTGQEFNKICVIQTDASVRYAGLNVIFSLHE